MTDLPQLACLSQPPEVLTLAAKDAVLLEGRLHELVIGLLEEALSRACGGGERVTHYGSDLLSLAWGAKGHCHPHSDSHS